MFAHPEHHLHDQRRSCQQDADLKIIQRLAGQFAFRLQNDPGQTERQTQTCRHATPKVAPTLCRFLTMTQPGVDDENYVADIELLNLFNDDPAFGGIWMEFTEKGINTWFQWSEHHGARHSL